VPDKATFLSKFDMELVDVTESDKYLIDTLKEEYLYYKSVPIIQQAAELLKTDSNLAAEYLVR
jgi:replicative DNA helicase